MLVPWAAPGSHYENQNESYVDRLDSLLQDLEAGQFLFDAARSGFVGPPGFDHFIASTVAGLPNPDYDAMRFSQQCLSRYIGSLARGLRRPSNTLRRVQGMYRGRCAQAWNRPDPEGLLFPEDYARANARRGGGGGGGPGDSGDESDDPRRAATLAAIAAFTRNLVASAGGPEASRRALEQKLRKYLDDFNTLLSVIHPASTGAQPMQTDHAGSHRDSTVSDASASVSVPPLYTAADSTPNLLPSIGANVPTQLNIPVPVVTISTAAPAAYSRLADESLPGPATATLMRLRGGPRPPNEGQVRILEEFAVYYDDVHADRPSRPPQIFLDGPGGVGKSATFAALEQLALSIGRPIAVSALTGVAATAIPTLCGVGTTASMYKFGRMPGQAVPLTNTALLSADAVISSAITLIVDEVSFAAPSTKATLSHQLYQISILQVGKLVQNIAIHCASTKWRNSSIC